MTTIRRSAIVPYNAGEMFALVADVESYPGFLPWCGGARILSTDEDVIVAAIDIAYKGVKKSFTTRNRLQQDKMMEMHLVEGPFRYLKGYWRFSSLDEGASKIALDLEFECASRMMALTLGPVFSNIAGSLVGSFCKRADALYASKEHGR